MEYYKLASNASQDQVHILAQMAKAVIKIVNVKQVHTVVME
jgi:hypothetical protein